MATIKELRRRLDNKELSVKQLLDEYFAKIRQNNAAINAFITVTEAEAYAQAGDAQKLIDDGKALPLTGIPLAIKDNISTKDIPTTCASKMLSNYVPTFDATVISKLKKQGAIIVGKTNMDEFAMGSTSETSYFGSVKNPINTEYVPGGSSGGSAACVADGMAVAALGSDTGGSIRQPAAFCGVTGLKPTYGRVSRYGLVAFASSLDQIGPIASSAEDCGIILNAIAGGDEFDMTSSSKPVDDFTSAIGDSLKGKVIGLPKEFFEAGLTEEVKNSVFEAVEVFKKLGCEVKEVSLKSLKYAVSAYYLISSAEASSNLSRYDGIKYGYRSEKGDTYHKNVRFTRDEGFGREVKRRILLGIYGLSSGYYDAYYNKAVLVRSKIMDEYNAIFEQCDLIISPTAPTTAFKIGNNIDDPVKLYMADIYTVTTNIAGLPAISTPCGKAANGLPIGLQITGKAFDERQLVAVCAAYEKSVKGGAL
ncbi:MAG: Asp-tRNA(Asn)/Glu-tRNA(Gln) amidotransferase subunit GatA [Clostridia bacterium]|nr:Asp-tRNA(Asn)/Glu-tRNA(Gln) amidotransferase subunit GatA [Clostridia bacterium]